MKKLFIEPDMEILTFRCETGIQPDSIKVGGVNGIPGDNGTGNPPDVDTFLVD